MFRIGIESLVEKSRKPSKDLFETVSWVWKGKEKANGEEKKSEILRKIIHIDMDAFYASVEQRDCPELRGRPIAVGYDGPRGVVATASYEARRYGVHSAISSVRARNLCPSLIFVAARMDHYKSISRQIQAIFHDYTSLVEPLSLDEAFLDVSHVPSATLLAREIKERIRTETGLTASAGVSVNKMLAKIASDYRKPDGLFVIPPAAITDFVSGLPIEKFFGIGAVTARKMHRLGIRNGADLRQWSETDLIRYFGKPGRLYYDYARGVDRREVVPDRIRKSLGAETTFEEDVADRSVLREKLVAVQQEVWRRLDQRRFVGRTVVLKLKYDDFRQITRSRTLSFPIDGPEPLLETALELLEQVDFEGRKVRLLGLTVANALKPAPADRQLRLDFGEKEWEGNEVEGLENSEGKETEWSEK